ncbi:TIGR04282 family arsenosugar biosynthesis glycosyltransferase [Rhodohalobacter sp. 8-1]|uniref:TIGR04282 family arsenosugar biosynthesis glycosyltransferase n=1 Tax=Rhodohalobacter sp. 8-1 TaxID=3131972 RepID=UPI0030EE89C9
MPESPISHTAVLYFSLSSEAEARNKTFTSEHGYQANVRIAGLLRGHTYRQITHSGLPCYMFDEENQTGESFGEKLVNACIAVFEKGYDHVITVGNDTPGLNSRHLIHTSELLEDGNASIVLGPAADGGTWLMGFSRDAFNPDDLKSLPWKSSSLLSSLVERFGEKGNLHLLDRFRDIDHADDLKIFLHNGVNSDGLQQLRSLINILFAQAGKTFLITKHLPTTSDYHFSFLLRGPPSPSDIFLITT